MALSHKDRHPSPVLEREGEPRLHRLPLPTCQEFAPRLIDAINVKRSARFEIDNTPFSCLEVEANTPNARCGRTLCLKIRNLITNAVCEKTFKTSEKFRESDLQTVPASYPVWRQRWFLLPGQTEDGRFGADSKRQHGNGSGREPGLADQHANTVAKVAKQASRSPSSPFGISHVFNERKVP